MNDTVLIQITRSAQIPDPIRLERYLRLPEIGPKVLFFSGGTALRSLSQELIQYTHNSIHIISTFDSGGSSAVLREAFQMPAIGDIRNRLMALADRSHHGNPEIFDLFSYRLPAVADQQTLQQEMDLMIEGRHPLVAAIPDPMRKIIRNYLYLFNKRMPKTFNLRKASIGNLILTGGYLESQRRLDPMIFVFSKLVEVRGIVRPILNKNLNLVAELENNTILVGQHLITGKEGPAIQSKVRKLYLSESCETPKPYAIPVRDKLITLIKEAELICYPMGSFYTSIIANFLPQGVGKAISQNRCPKIFIPNTTHDSELFETDVADQVDLLLAYLKQGNPELKTEDLLNFILIDSANPNYPGGIDSKRLKAHALTVIDYSLISDASFPYIDARKIVPVLLSTI